MFFREVLHALGERKARYALVGGVAVALQGVPRMTFDLDLVPALDRDNLLRVDSALRSLNLRPRLPVRLDDATDPNLRADWLARNLLSVAYVDFERPMREVDVLVNPPVPVEELLEQVDVRNLAGVAVPVASVSSLIALKLAAGRPQDLADVAVLQALVRE